MSYSQVEQVHTSREKILTSLEKLASKPGFIYTLAILLRQDLFIDPSQAADVNWEGRLIYQEFSLLIGLMVKYEIVLDLPSKEQIESDVKEVYTLFEQLHHTFVVSPDKFELGFNGIKKESDFGNVEELKEFFGSGKRMSEPIFYSGSAAYDFQYGEIAPEKYTYDSDWLMKNKNFSIGHAVKIAHHLKKIVEVKSTVKLKEFSHTGACQHILDLFCFHRADLGLYAIDETINMIDAFSLIPGTVNQNFNAIGQYNYYSSNPIIKLRDDLYFLPISFILFQSIYESPFYWMFKDSSYKNIASKNRGRATEDIAYRILEPIFGSNILRDVRVQKSKSNHTTDIDILAITGNKAIVFQAKSKRLTELSRTGNTEKIKTDFKEAVQKAYEQGLICRDAILNKSNKLFDRNDNEIKLNESLDDVYLICVISDDYPALTHQVDTYLEKKTDDPFAVAISLFDLDIISYYLKDSFEFTYYFRQRIEYGKYFKAASEMSFLGFHLNQKLYRLPNSDWVMLDESFAQLIDGSFPALKGHQPKTKSTEKLHHKWTNRKFQDLIDQVRETEDPGFTDAIFYLFDLSGDGADDLTNQIEKTIKKTKFDGKNHDFTFIYDDGKSGITFLSQRGSAHTLSENLLLLAQARKYKTKANIWLALGSLVEDGKMINAIAFAKFPWEHDPQLEEFSKIYLKPGTPIGKHGKKIGRNEPCPCGKTKSNGEPMKYKNCCESKL